MKRINISWGGEINRKEGEFLFLNIATSFWKTIEAGSLLRVGARMCNSVEVLKQLFITMSENVVRKIPQNL